MTHFSKIITKLYTVVQGGNQKLSYLLFQSFYERNIMQKSTIILSMMI